MREAIGSSLLLNIALVFIGIISLILVSSIAYSKAYKAKNQIISVIEEYNGVCNFRNGDSCFDEIERKLSDMGYSSNISQGCPTEPGTLLYGNVSGSVAPIDGHVYCVYKYTICDPDSNNTGTSCPDDSNEKTYYKVITFMHFDIPLIGQFLEFPVSGETQSFYNRFANIKY